jgi:(p)ppGpp synthase/HD superfamily hydrolase
MKLLFENWRKYLVEDDAEDPKLAAKIAAKKAAFDADKKRFLDGLTKELADKIEKAELFQKLAGAIDPKTGEAMPVGKQAHSARVGMHAIASGDDEAIVGALMHDYVERGGNIDELDIDEKAKDIIRHLSSSEEEVSNYAGKNEPLHHMKQVFKTLDDAVLKTNLATIKVGDRVDNLNRRALFPKRKPLTKKYVKKSRDLIKWLRGQAAEAGGTKSVDSVLNALHPDAKWALATVDQSFAQLFPDVDLSKPFVFPEK